MTFTASALYRLGVAAARNARKVLVLWALAVLVSLAVLPGFLGSLGLPVIGIQNAEATRAADVLVKDFPVVGRDQMYLAFRSERLIATDVSFEAAMRAAALVLSKHEGVVSVLWLPRAADPQAKNGAAVVGPFSFHSVPYRDPHNAYILVGSKGDDVDLIKRFAGQRAAVEQAVRQAAGDEVKVYFAGRIPHAHEMRAIDLAESTRTEMLTIPLALCVLMFGLGALGSAIVPVLTSVAAIVVNLGVFAMLGGLIRFDVNLLTVSSITGFAVGIDYLLLLTSRYKEELRAGAKRDHAIGIATATAGKTIIYSGLVTIVASCCLLIVQTPLLTQFGVGVGAAVLIAIVAALSLGPVILVRWAHLLDRGRLPWLAGDKPSDRGPWARWARHVVRRPLLYCLTGVGILTLFALPATDIRSGSDLEIHAAKNTMAGQARQLFEEDSFAGGPAWISLAVPREATQTAELSALVSRLRADESVVSVGLAYGRNLTGVTVIPRDRATSPETTDLVRRIRSEIIPATLSKPDSVLTGGAAALIVDDYDEVMGKLWIVITAIVVTSFLLLLLMFRSLLIAIKAVLTNALAVGAGIGTMVAVFQWGLGEGVFGFESNGATDYYSPYFIFVFVYALSMDYEIFLVRRMQEIYTATHDNDRAIVVGVQRTIRPIALAAITMIVVYSGLLFSDSVGLKQLGLAIIVALAIDATLIRMVVVPASMKILGRWNWWLPWVTPQHSASALAGQVRARQAPRKDPART